MISDLRKDIIEASREVKDRESAPYDGVMGVLPHFPESFRREFIEIRNYLLKDYSHEELLGYIAEAERIIQAKREVDSNKSGYIRYQIPPDIDRDIFTLTGFKKADRLYKEVSKEACLAFLTDPKHANLVKKGSDYSAHQSKNASKPRGKIKTDYGNTTISEIIKELSTKEEFADWTAIELWEAFLGELDRHLLNPEENANNTDQRKWFISYEEDKGERKPITFGQFANVVSVSRRKEKK